jgi:hypothetical protein
MRQHGPGGVQVSHYMQLPLVLPDFVAGVCQQAAAARTGVGTEQIDLSIPVDCLLHQIDDLLFVRDVTRDAIAADVGGGRLN